MKLVNPNYLGIERNYKFSSVVIDCKKFKDKYTNAEYATSGCFGCEYMTFGWRHGECAKSYVVRKIYIRMTDDGKLHEGCKAFVSRYRKYAEHGCAACDSSYKSMGRIKCRFGYNVSEETIRIG